MKKQARTLIVILVTVLLLVALLLGLLFLLPEKNEDTSSETSSEPTINVVSKSTDGDGKAIDQPVKKVTLKNQKDDFTIAQNEEKQLVVKGYEDLPVGTSEIESLTGQLSSLTATREIASDSVNIADYGLDKPKATAAVTYHDDSVITFELGNDVAGDGGSYVRLNQKGPIYVVDASFSQQLLKESVMYIGTSLITPPKTKTDDSATSSAPGDTSSGDTAVMKNMKLSGTVRKDKPFTFGVNTETEDGVYTNFNYVITAPIKKGTADSATTIAQAVTSLDAVQAVKAHPTAANLKEYGLDKPYSICDLTLAVQTSSTKDDKTVTSYYNTTKHQIKLGKKDEEGNYYALVDEYNAVYLVASTSVPWAETQFGDVVTTLLYLRDITTIKSIDVQTKESKTTFELTHYPKEEDRDKSMVVKVGGKTYSTPDFRSLYQVFMSIYRYGDADKKPTGDADIILSVNPNDTKDTKVVAKFYRLDASLYTCVLSDGDVFTVKASDIDKFHTELSNYLNGKPVKS